MNLSEMRRILDAGEIQLTKSLGQNFLHDSNQLRRIAEAGELNAASKVLEIGPGLGPLTEQLLDRSGEVLAVEMDQRLVEFLKKRFAERKNFSLLHADALRWLRENPRDWSEWKLVANLPYSVGSPILVELAQAPGSPERLVATLQMEVIRRLRAKEGDDDYGLLTLLVQLRYAPAGSFKIPASCFFPAPNVDSGCVTLIRRAEALLPLELEPVFLKIVRRAFSQRRKMMAKLLKNDWNEERLMAALATIGVPPQARAETISLGQFVGLTKLLA